MTNDRRAMGFGLAAVGCWSTVATAFKYSLQHMTTQQLLFYATLTATLVLLTVAVYQSGISTLLQSFRKHWGITLLAGALNPVVYYEVLFRAYDLLPAQIAMSINYTWAIVLTFMVAIFLRQKMRWYDFAAAFICYSGVVVIASQGSFAGLSESTVVSAEGVGLAMVSTLLWASYWIINMRDQREPVVGLALNFTVALPVVALNCWWFSTFEVPAIALGSAVYVGLMEMALGFLFWSTALRLTSNASRVSNLIFLSPFLSLIFIYFVLGEIIHLATLWGLMLIISGLAWQQWQHVLEKPQTGPT